MTAGTCMSTAAVSTAPATFGKNRARHKNHKGKNENFFHIKQQSQMRIH